MNLDQRFAVFCAKRVLHLWKAPKVVIDWLDNPQQETTQAAADAAHHASYTALEAIATYAATTAYAAARSASLAAGHLGHEGVGYAVNYAARALNMSIEELRQEFLNTWTEEDLSTTDPDWIEFATAEILNREMAT